MAAKWLKKVGQHLKGIAPLLVGAAGTALGGPAAGGVLATIMREVTGAGEDVDLDIIADEIFGTPELRMHLEELAVDRERLMADARIRELEIEAATVAVVNETMREEARAEDPWTRRWRPYFGFVAGTAFGLQIIGVVYVMVTGGDPKLITEVAGLTIIWAPAMAVLGVTSWGRSKEKTALIENGKANG